MPNPQSSSLEIGFPCFSIRFSIHALPYVAQLMAAPSGLICEWILDEERHIRTLPGRAEDRTGIGRRFERSWFGIGTNRWSKGPESVGAESFGLTIRNFL